MTDLDALLAGIVADPLEETRWLVLADWLDEFDDPRRAELLRLHRRMLATCCEPDAHSERAAWQGRMTELLVAGVRPCVPQETLTLPGGVPMTFSFIPPGAFLMGSDAGELEEMPRHRAEVPQGFFMGIYPVTQAQWFAVMSTDPSRFKGAERPVEMVSWEDSQAFCVKLSVLVERSVELPTEEEWEYACRAGTTTEYHFGDQIDNTLANYDTTPSKLDAPASDYRKQTTDVGTFPANPWVLYDVHGNTAEWCSDSVVFPNLGDTGEKPVVSEDRSYATRGGTWWGHSRYCRSASRVSESVSTRDDVIGFRVCLRIS